MTATLHLVEDEPAFEQLAAEWPELLASSDADRLFLTWDWLRTWWRHLAEGRRLRVVTVRTGGALVAVAPFCIRPAGLRRSPVLPCLEPLGAGEIGSDALDVVVRRGSERESIALLADRLARETHAFSMGRLRSGSNVAALADALFERGWTVTEHTEDASPFILLRGRSFDTYLSELGSSHRYAFRRRLRGLERRYRVELDRVAEPAALAESFQALRTLHAARWRGRGKSEAFTRPALVRFHEDFAATALARGWLRLFLLRLDGRPTAAILGYAYGGVFSFYQSGFDPAHEKESVGLVALGLCIRALFAEGEAEFDFGHGEESYKKLWARETRPLVRIEIFPPGARGRLYRQATFLERRARRVVRSLVGPGDGSERA